MPLPPELEPKTYWERRASLAEESLFRFMFMMKAYFPSLSHDIDGHVAEWTRLLGELQKEHTK